MKSRDTCTKCGSYSPTYLLNREWMDDLIMFLNMSENEHIAPDTVSMSDLELFQLFLSLKNKQEE